MFIIRFYSILFYIFLLSFFQGQVDNLRFQRLTLKEGLSQSSINAIIQDHYGFIWLGTQDGLNRFDGINVTHYKHQIKNKATLSNSYVTSILESKDHILWVSTLNGGLNYKHTLDQQFNRIKKKELLGNLNIVDLHEFGKNFIWMATEQSGLLRYRLEDDSLQLYGPSKGITTTSWVKVITFKNQLVAVSKGEGIFLYNDETDIFSPVEKWNKSLVDNSINDIYNYNDSILFVATNKGVFNYDDFENAITNKMLTDKIISSIFCEDSHQIWAGTRGEGLFGVSSTSENDVVIKNYRNNTFDLNSISSDMIFDIFQDFSGNIWITTEEGVSYFDPLKQNFSLVTNNIGGKQKLDDKNIWTIYEENDSIVWVGTRKGLSKINLLSKITLNYPFYSENRFLAANNDIWDIYVDEYQQFWVGTNSGIYTFHPNSNDHFFKKFSPHLEELNQPIFDINFRNKDELWAATKNGLYAFDLKKKTSLLFSPDTFSDTLFPDHPCRRIIFSSKNDIWLGFDGGGLCKLSQTGENLSTSNFQFIQYKANEEAENSISNNTVLSICEGDENTLWVGTFGGGLNKLNLQTNTFEIFSESEGLSNNNIYGIIKDANGHLWISTNFGISEFITEENLFRNYNEGNGLQSNEFNNNSFCQSMSGRIYFGGINGFNYFSPKEIMFNKTAPRTLITDIKWLNDGKFENFLTNKNPYAVDTILLTFFQNDLAFTFSSLHFSDAKSNEFKIHLSGMYDAPLNMKNANTINYSNLSAGEYVFKVWSSNVDGVWSQPREILIIVSPPFWFTWEFYVALGVFLLLITWFVYILRVKSIKRQQRRLAFLVERRTKTITKQKNQIEIQNKKIEREKEKADELLLNILPQETADELKNKGVAKTRQYRKVTVMFTDIKDFSKVAETMDPDRLVKSLDNLFREFDKIIEKYEIEKIKTMGDAYMAVGGVPLRDKENPINCVLAALEIQRFMERLKQESIERGEGFWELRIGIHTGDVIAGVIGSKRIAYDVWGSTVNIAQRIETSGETWKVNISESTYEQIFPYFQCTDRGKIPTKNTGDISMYFVEGIKPHLSVKSEGIIPNKKFREYVDLHLYSSINYRKAERHIMKVLKDGLPDNLHYHGIHHTYDVVKAVERIAIMEGVMDEDIFVLKSAATYHDAGFVEKYDKNEPIGARLAEEILPKYGYTDHQIEQVKELIYATIIPHKPKNKLEQIICDADLDYLGRDDFFKISETLRRELRDHGKINSDRLWDEIQVKFLTQHKYFTKSAKKMRDAKKAEHLEAIKKRLQLNQYKD